MGSRLHRFEIRKAAKKSVLAALKNAGAFRLARRAHRPKLRILAYHGIWNADDGFPGDMMFMRPDTFRRRIGLLDQWGYRVVSLEEGLRLSRSGLAEDAVVITIDDGWWSTGSLMWPVLQSMSYPATLYVDTAHLLAQEPVTHVMANYLGQLVRRGQVRMKGGYPLPAPKTLERVESLIGHSKQRHRPAAERLELVESWAAELHIDVQHYTERRLFDYVSTKTLRAVSKSGLDVQLHTHQHSLGDFGRASVEAAIETNRRILAEVCGVSPESLTHFCYPSGRSSPRAEPALKALGIRSATLASPGLVGMQSNPYFLPRILDGDHIDDLEFEAELCGVMSWVRFAKPSSFSRFKQIGPPGVP